MSLRSTKNPNLNRKLLSTGCVTLLVGASLFCATLDSLNPTLRCAFAIPLQVAAAAQPPVPQSPVPQPPVPQPPVPQSPVPQPPAPQPAVPQPATLKPAEPPWHASFVQLPPYSYAAAQGPKSDWLVAGSDRRAGAYRRGNNELILTNGLVRRIFRLDPNLATVALDRLNRQPKLATPLVRAVKPEAQIELLTTGAPSDESANSQQATTYAIGGLQGQPENAYLLPEWLDTMTSDGAAFQLTTLVVSDPKAPFPWKRTRRSEERAWPPTGIAVTFGLTHPQLPGVTVEVHYELYDAIPAFMKQLTLRNGSEQPLQLKRFKSEILAIVEEESPVEVPDQWRRPPLHVESDYAFHGMTLGSANETTHWVPDPEYTSQVNYRRQTPNLLESRPRIGPDVTIHPQERFKSFRTFVLLHDADDRERRGLAQRALYRTIAPWVTENPILMHVRHSDRKSLRLAIDQCAEVGFEMVILTFGSGFNMESEDPQYRKRLREDIEYAHSRGIEVGGYSLLASRRVSDEDDVINPKTLKPGGAIYGNSPCLCSTWGEAYFRRIASFIEETGLDLLEHDGNYPGDICASTRHPHHRGETDSQWRQWQRITRFYRECRARGVYLNVPDWYFLSGSNKVGMGYRETNWSLPRERQILLGRQNIYDGTWAKTPSMGWMFVPLVQYHGGGEAATLEPLSEHLDAYEAHLCQNFCSGVQACYRGPRLYDSDTTRDVVKKWVSFYRQHREILDSDIIHVQRPNGRDLDVMLHVNPRLATRAFAAIYNPTSTLKQQRLQLPLYYSGLTGRTTVTRVSPDLSESASRMETLDALGNVNLEVEVPPHGVHLLTFGVAAAKQPR